MKLTWALIGAHTVASPGDDGGSALEVRLRMQQLQDVDCLVAAATDDEGADAAGTRERAHVLDLSLNDVERLPAAGAHWPALRALDLSLNHLCDVAPLAAAWSLPRLQVLNLSNNRIGQLEPLGALTTLTELVPHW